MPPRRWLSREVLVAAWLVLVIGFLWVRLPGFWRSPYERFVEAQRLAGAGQIAAADAEMRMAIDEDPHNAGFLTYHGYLQLQLQDARGAAESFTRALEQGPRNEAVLGLAQALAGRPAEARVVLRRLDLGSLTDEQRYRRLSMLAASGDPVAAVSDRAFIEQRLTDPARLRDALRWAMAARDWTLAIGLADRVAERPATSADRRAALGEKSVALRASGRFADALAVLDAIGGDDTLEPRAQLALQLEQFPQAASLFTTLVATRPTVESRVALAYALDRAGRRREAADAYRAVVDEAGPPARIALAHLLNTLSRHGEAWRALEALPRPVLDAATRRLLANTAFWSGRLDEADALLVGLGSTRPEDAETEAALAASFWRAGRPADADRVYQRMLAAGRLPRADRLAFVDTLIARGRHDEAWQVLEAAAPADIDVIGRRARVAVWTGRYPAALPLLRAWLARYPEDADRWRDLAETARQLGDSGVELEALDGYARHGAHDVAALVRRGGLLERAGRIDEALGAYQAAVERDPRRGDVWRTIGYLHDRQRRPIDAVRAYTHAWTLAPDAEGETALSIARLLRAGGQAAEAASWYERALRGRLDAGARRDVAVERAWAEIDAGRLDAAAAQLEDVLRDDTRQAPALIAAARVESLRGQPTAAVRHLRRLQAVRPLTVEELRWLAGQLRASGDLKAALAEYDALIAGAPATDADLLAVGDLRASLGDPGGALAAYGRVTNGPSRPAAELASARVLARGGRFVEAVGAYRRYLGSGSPDGLRLELARVYLGAQDFAQAERWAREATDHRDERGPIADVVLAEALHLQGRARESRRLVEGLPLPLPTDPSLLEALAHLAASRDEHLRATRLYTEALAHEPANAGELAYWRGRSAALRGDAGRALPDLARARASGDVPALVARGEADVRLATSPLVAVPAGGARDSNGLASAMGGVAAEFWSGRRVPLSFELLSGVLAQGRASYTRTRVRGGVDARVSAPLRLEAQAGLETYGASTRLFVGGARATYTFENRSSLSVAAWQDSLWAVRDRLDVRQFTRGVDLAALGPGFRVRGAEAALDAALGARDMARVQAGGDWFGDGNQRRFVYGHYQYALQDRPGIWTAFRPSLYWESFERTSPFYFSPETHLTLGTAWHTVRSTPIWRVEAEVAPRLTWLGADVSSGAFATVDLSRRIGPASAGVAGFAFYDRRTDYWSWRIAGQIGIRLGK